MRRNLEKVATFFKINLLYFILGCFLGYSVHFLQKIDFIFYSFEENTNLLELKKDIYNSNSSIIIPEELLIGTLPANDEESDLLYLGCDNESENLKHKIAIVIPFIFNNVNQVMENIGFWNQKELFPCDLENSDRNLNIDLVFWFHRALECNPSIIISIKTLLAQFVNVKKCFKEIHFLSPHLPKKLDYYGDGTILMFYRLFQNPFIQKNYDFIFLMESDVLPVQKNWLNALWKHCYQIPEGFWQKGGSVRAPRFLERGWGADYHINGNSLYKTGNRCFENFLKRVQSKYPHKPFDMAIKAYREDESRFPELQRFMHKFVFSDFIHNYGDGFTVFSRETVVKKSPYCFLVHSKLKKPEEYLPNQQVMYCQKLIQPFIEECSSLIEDYKDNWDFTFYQQDRRDYWKNIYQSKQY